ncbi:MAG TPA: hypothetical protein VKA46_26890 [Gemmataceae bacterium]|nr:hypothetical protein [Gemmataceae bacterium]
MAASRYTLVHQPESAGAEQDRLFRVQMGQPYLARSLRGLRPDLRRTFLNAAFPPVDDNGQFSATLNALATMLARLPEEVAPVTVGVWDIEAYVPRRACMIETLNAGQPVFVFFDVYAAVPAGLVTPPERDRTWVRKKLRERDRHLPKDGPTPRPSRRVAEKLYKRDKRHAAAEAQEIAPNLIADDFYGRAEVVRKDLGIDYLVGVTAEAIAGEDEDGGIFFDYFSTWDGKIILVSTYQMREFAQTAGRPFEVAVAILIIAQLLVTMNPRLEYHDPDNGTLFDFNRVRQNCIPVLRYPTIDPADLKKIAPRHRAAVEKLMAVLQMYGSATT